MKKYFLTLILLFLLPSCSSNGYRFDKDFRLSEKNNNSNNAIIIVKVETKSVDYKGRVFDRNFNKMNWCQSEKNGECKDILYFNPYTKIKFRSDKDSDFDYDIYSVKPGHYYLNEIQQFRGNFEDWHLFPITIPLGMLTFGNSFNKISNFSNTPSGWNKKLNAPNFASFEVKSNEIVYIGNLFFTFTKQRNWRKGKINLEIIDDYEEAVSYFKDKHPEYKNKVVTKLLVQPGILLNNYDGGFFW